MVFERLFEDNSMGERHQKACVACDKPEFQFQLRHCLSFPSLKLQQAYEWLLLWWQPYTDQYAGISFAIFISARI